MAHVAKYTRSTCGLLTRHYERYKNKEHPEEVKYKNQDIDSERTHLNYNLAPEHQQMSFLKYRLEEVHCLKRDDVNVMCDWVVTAPKELPEEHQKEFFEVCYKHLAKKYGEKNVISAYVHMDENQPHMHFAFVPVIYDQKKDREKVSAKELLSRVQLKQFHPELQKVINNWITQNEYDFECNILNGATAGGNKTVEELKIERLTEIRKEKESLLNETNKQLSDLTSMRDNLKSEATELAAQISEAGDKLKIIDNARVKAEDRLKTVQEGVQEREIYLGVLNTAGVNKMSSRARENVVSKLKGKDEVIIDRSDFNKLLNTAKLVDDAKKAMNKAALMIKKANIEAENIIKTAEDKADKIIRDSEQKGIKISLERAKKEIELEKYKNLEKNYPDIFRQMENQSRMIKLNINKDLER